MFACTGDSFSGTCFDVPFVDRVCTNFPAELQDNISSISPDSGWTCLAFAFVFYTVGATLHTDGTNCSDLDCSDAHGHITIPNPGFPRLGDLGWNDKLSSFSCTANRV